MWGLSVEALVFCCWALTVGWKNPLLDMHSFRQTQTAISVLFMARGGSLLNYETPVLGAPWSCPYEFPLYQWLVLLVHQLGAPLDQSGRTVSIVFLFLSYLAIFRLMLRIGFTKSEAQLSLAVFLVSPHYLFWGRAFLIETTALALGLWFLLLTFQILYDDFSNHPPTMWHFTVALLTGLLAALVKITTYVIFPLLALLLAAVFLSRDRRLHFQLLSRAYLPAISRGTILLVLPLAASIVWTKHTDRLKEQIPFARMITSKSLTRWNFGTLDQRLSLTEWNQWLFARAFPDLTGHITVATVFLFLFLLAPAWRAWTAFWLLAFLVPPLVFTNLYFVHNYYQSANGFFLLFAIISVIIGLSRNGYLSLSAIAFGFVIFCGMQGYVRGYYPWTVEVDRSYYEVAKRVQTLTKPDDVILIYGNDWSSQIPYYAERRAVMDRSFRPLDDTDIRRTIELSVPERGFGAIVACGPILDSLPELESRAAELGFRPTFYEDSYGCRIMTSRSSSRTPAEPFSRSGD